MPRHDVMVEFWFVVRPGNDTVYEALKEVMSGRPGFYVTKDRRRIEGTEGWNGEEHRTANVWSSDVISIAEYDRVREC
ncbi:MAG TPA: hypothetical protein VFQ06_02600 [Nitrospira sp.]|nr:hypothetical protein [Nitrospira sp.]